MNGEPPDDQKSDLPGYREELAAGIVVEKMLTRARLEAAAKGPDKPAWLWLIRLVAAMILIVLGQHPEHQWGVIMFLVIYLLSGNGEAQIHARIDAILELAELKKKAAQPAAEVAEELGK